MRKPILTIALVLLWAATRVSAQVTDTSAHLAVTTSVPASAVTQTNSPGKSVPSGKNLILFAKPFQEAAEGFQAFHRDAEGVDTVIEAIEDIARTETPAQPPGFSGWATQAPDSPIKGYNFTLARKIISYLQKKLAEKEISSVLLLGNAGILPPSYYFFSKNVPGGDKYNAWVPTDFFYASPDLDLACDFAVGRISVESNAAALRVLAKYRRWKRDQGAAPASRNIYAGANVTHDARSLGEMFYLMLQHEKVFGREPMLHLESLGGFTRKSLLRSLASEPANLMWIYGHGSGDGFITPDGPVTSEDVASLPYKAGLPLVLSPSCMDGGFDHELARPPYDTDGCSVGEAILQAPGAGLGYLGAARASFNKLDFDVDKGTVKVAEALLLNDLLLQFLIAFQRDGKHRIGDAMVTAYRKLYEEDQLEMTLEHQTYFNLVLLGDPVLSLPTTPDPPNSSFAGLTIVGSHTFNSRGMIAFPAGTRTIRLAPPHGSREIVLTVTNTTTNETVLRQESLSDPRTLSLPGDGVYRLISQDETGTMVWQFVAVEEPDDG